MEPATHVKAIVSEKVLELKWDQLERRIPFQVLRGLCPCAVCVNELTGVRRYHIEDAPAEIHPQKMELVGNYALKFWWSDGHHTGIYHWDYLKRISESVVEAVDDHRN